MINSPSRIAKNSLLSRDPALPSRDRQGAVVTSYIRRANKSYARPRARGFFHVCAAPCLLAILVLAVLTPSARAQVAAAISGTIEDASGAGVSGATVTVNSLETGATRTTITDDTGNFSVLSLPLGAQEVKAEKMGFKAAVRTGINLEVGQQAVVNLQLEVGEFVQQVTVSEDAPVVNTTTLGDFGRRRRARGEGSAAQRPQLRQSDHAESRRRSTTAP